ncbi:NUDIX hydrolase [Mucisphaera calidilacus]|uniref:GDP-mannose pyrophosphatase n=1 Tax=Mucisphaera calidilacus TaxID=2527982 RepID=A0A518BUR4_9BACT|nr:NUDIX hydrolase [Mucisphaera calidilacus]QDU70719.1 ADP-ribose pyrophosphatase [Mucisphaera calidilacus]
MSDNHAERTEAERSELTRYARFAVEQMPLARRDGGTVHAQYIRPADAVVVLPMFANRDVMMIRNHRFAVGLELWELPAGTIDPGEDPLVCAHRELEEETGYAAVIMEPVTDFVTCPGLCTERIYAYMARDLTASEQKLDQTEQIVPERVSWERAMSMVQDGTIRDAKTIATLLFAECFLRQELG